MNLQKLSQKLEDHLTDQDIQDAQELLDNTVELIANLKISLQEQEAVNTQLNINAVTDAVCIAELEKELTEIRPTHEKHRILQAELKQIIVLKDQRIAELLKTVETSAHKLVACGVAATGWFDGCHVDYQSASLTDVLSLREKYEKQLDTLNNSYTTCSNSDCKPTKVCELFFKKEQT